jgi:putative FmdB family regulatory protein
MPVYEYSCNRCKKVSSFLTLRASEEVLPFCRSCGSKDVTRLISRIALLKGDERRMEALLNPSNLSDLDENDPKSIERLMKRLGKEMGDEFGEGLEEAIEEGIDTAETGLPPVTEE